MTTTQTQWTVEKLQARMARDPKAVERALVTLFYQQTETERATKTTREDNSVGFNGVDAEILSSFAEQIIRNRGGYPDGRKLSPKQLALAQRKVRKYAAQLLRLSGIKPVRTSKETPAPAPLPILQWAEQVPVTERSQHAWHDGWMVAVPINLSRTDATEAEIRAEIATHNQSSWGALRWATYRYVSRTATDVLVEVTEHLCD